MSILKIALLGSAVLFSGAAFATTLPQGNSHTETEGFYVLPGEMDSEGPSIYRMENRSTFYGGSVRSGPHQPARSSTCDGEPC